MSMERQITSEVVKASAGFGKTERLAVRLIGLFLAAEDMEKELTSVVAVTFTRAAAGEIYERLITMVCGALSGDDGRKTFLLQFEEAEFAPELADPERLLTLLGLLTSCMNKLNLCTCDSFMTSVVQSFPLELGLPGKAEMIAPRESARFKTEILQKMFSGKGDALAGVVDICRDLISAETARDCSESIREMITECDEYYFQREYSELWGQFIGLTLPSAERRERWYNIWSDYYETNRTNMLGWRDLDRVLLICRDITAQTTFPSKLRERLNSIFMDWGDGKSPFPSVDGLGWMEKIEGEALEAVRGLLFCAGKVAIARAGRRTAALRELYCRYVQEYRREVIGRGMVEFSDIAHLLCDGENEWVGEVHYRLNSRLKHWLIDEFQDTSAPQLRVFNNAIDTVEAGDRSLFIVGDIKQAIYSWRAGDYTLMAYEEEQFNLRPNMLHHSYRYGADICAGLNKIFRAEAFLHAPVSDKVKQDWLAAWTEHEPGRKVDGVMELVQFTKSKDSKLIDSARFIATRLREISWEERGLDCAILVATNKNAQDLIGEFADIEPSLISKLVWEGSENIGSDKLVAAIVAFLTYVEHPGDRACESIVRMCQLTRELPDQPSRIAATRRDLAMFGYHAAVTSIVKSLTINDLEYADRQGGFSMEQADSVEMLLAAARMFDASSRGGDAIDFADFVNGFARQGVAMEGKIRIMTVHHSKGLTFDVVFAICNNSGNFFNPDAKKFVSHRDNSYDLNCLIHSPGKAGFCNDSLASALRQEHDISVFERLCTAYVALTRARRAVFALLPVQNQNKDKCHKRGSYIDGRYGSYYVSDFLYEATFLDASLFEESFGDDCPANIVRFGEPWYLTEEIKRKDRKETVPPLEIEPSAGVKRYPRAEPAQKEEKLEFLLRLPAADGGAAAQGNRIHKAFEDVVALENHVLPATADESVRAHFAACMVSSDALALLSDHGAVWREKSFDLLLDGRWVSGRFDRVNLHLDASGKCIAADVVDFKSDKVDSANASLRAENYRSQLEVYRRAAERILQLQSGKVRVFILFTAIGQVIEL